jgi:hypothetical protein
MSARINNLSDYCTNINWSNFRNKYKTVLTCKLFNSELGRELYEANKILVV